MEPPAPVWELALLRELVCQVVSYMVYVVELGDCCGVMDRRLGVLRHSVVSWLRRGVLPLQISWDPFGEWFDGVHSIIFF